MVRTQKKSSKNYVIEVNSDNFKTEVLENNKKLLIDFYATWCGPCKALAPIIDEVAEENSEVKFVKINVDKCSELASQYGIQYMPTLVLIENGKEIDRSIGLIDNNFCIK